MYYYVLLEKSSLMALYCSDIPTIHAFFRIPSHLTNDDALIIIKYHPTNISTFWTSHSKFRLGFEKSYFIIIINSANPETVSNPRKFMCIEMQQNIIYIEKGVRSVWNYLYEQT